MQKTCTKCGKTFPATSEYFSKNSSSKSGFYCICKKCRSVIRKLIYNTNEEERTKQKEKSKEWYSKNKDSVKLRPSYDTKEYCKTYYKNNKDKDKLRHNKRISAMGKVWKHENKQIKELVIKQNNKCFYCGCNLEKYTIDHIVPVSRGGSNLIDNIAISCPYCNLSKGYKLLSEWKH
jgi:hypothetical protein